MKQQTFETFETFKIKQQTNKTLKFAFKAYEQKYQLQKMI